jgi:hypothetical protein
MADADHRCYQCRGTTSMEVLGPVSGEEAPLSMTVHGLPVRVCEQGHRQFAYSKVALQRLLRLGEDGGSNWPIGAERGRLFKRAACPDCGSGLEKVASRRRTFHVETQLSDAPPFGIDVTMPVYRCRGCGKEVLRSRQEIRGLAPAALVQALRMAGIGRE